MPRSDGPDQRLQSRPKTNRSLSYGVERDREKRKRRRGRGEVEQRESSLAFHPPYLSKDYRPLVRDLTYLGSCSAGNDELARPSRAADDAARSERVCRCSRQSRAFTLIGACVPVFPTVKGLHLGRGWRERCGLQLCGRSRCPRVVFCCPAAAFFGSTQSKVVPHGVV